MSAVAGAQVRLLGGLEIDGHPAGELGSRKARTLLGVLACARGNPVPSDELIDVLWGDDPPSRPADQLGVLVSRLRRVLGADVLPRVGRGYALRQAWLDVDEAHRRVADAEERLAAGSGGAARAAAEASLALAERGLLTGEDGDWIRAERSALDRAAARARSIVADAALRSGDAAGAAAAAAGALDHDPYDEAALRLLMRAHVAAGRPASALATYAEVRRRLAEELGVSPTAQTEAVHQAILLDERLTGGESSHPAVEAIVGRSTEQAILRHALDEAVGGRARLVVIEGEPGIGKTALLRDLVLIAKSRVAIIEGRCDAVGRELPLQPVIDGLDVLLAGLGSGGAEEVLGGDRAVVGPLLSRVDLGLEGDAGRLQPPGDPAAARALLYAALARVVQRLADRHGGIVVAIDDIHLAGASTIEWLQHIAVHGDRLLIVVTSRPGGTVGLAAASAVRLGPLGIEDAVTICGADRGPALHARSGGNPLFLKALAATGDDDEVPSGVRQVAADRVGALGPAAPSVLAAAVLGPAIDLDLIADALGVPARAVLDDLDAGLRAGLLADRGDGLGFAHELVREALVDTVSASRRAFLHREAARSLARRPHRDAMAVAWHARLGGDVSLAASELVVAARVAASRHDLAVAEQLVAESLDLEPSPAASLARTQFLMSRGAFDAAGTEAAHAIALGANAAGYEAAGWVAYYAREHVQALAFATDGARLDGDDASRAGCLALSGRILHSLGQLKEAERRLVAALEVAPPGRQGMARVWLGGLRVHQGRGVEALGLVDSALVDPASIGHPFAEGHGHFARWYAMGQLGRPAGAIAAIDRFEAAFEPGHPIRERFLPVTRNVRSWMMRSLLALDEAHALSAEALELAVFPNLAEPRVHAMIDLAEISLGMGDVAAAQRQLEQGEREPDQLGTMLWARGERTGLLRARLAFLEGDVDAAEHVAGIVARTANERGSRRHAVTAELLREIARSRSSRADPARIGALLGELDRCAAMESWRWTAEAAAAFDVDRWWGEAEAKAAHLAAAAGELGASFLDSATRHLAAVRSAPSGLGRLR